MTRNSGLDRVKSSVTETSPEDLIGTMEPSKLVKAVLFLNESDEVVKSFAFKSQPMEELTIALKAVVEVLHDCHAAMRGELTDTF